MTSTLCRALSISATNGRSPGPGSVISESPLLTTVVPPPVPPPPPSPVWPLVPQTVIVDAAQPQRPSRASTHQPPSKGRSSATRAAERLLLSIEDIPASQSDGERQTGQSGFCI